jgi:hypothetical protein
MADAPKTTRGRPRKYSDPESARLAKQKYGKSSKRGLLSKAATTTTATTSLRNHSIVRAGCAGPHGPAECRGARRCAARKGLGYGGGGDRLEEQGRVQLRCHVTLNKLRHLAKEGRWFGRTTTEILFRPQSETKRLQEVYDLILNLNSRYSSSKADPFAQSR